MIQALSRLGTDLDEILSNIMYIGVPCEITYSIYSHLCFSYLNICNYLDIQNLFATQSSFVQMQTKANAGKEMQGTVPIWSRPGGKIKFLILRIKKDLFIQFITSDICCLHQFYRLFKTKLKSILDVYGGYCGTLYKRMD